MYSSIKNKNKLKLCHVSALLGTGAIIALTGCSGGSSNGSGNNSNSALPSNLLVGLTNNNRLVTFNSRTPNNASTVNITGLTSGDAVVAIDYRFAAPGTVVGNGVTGLYAIGANAGTYQVYTIASNGAATAVGSRFTLNPPGGAISIDFNPVVDRIRLVEADGNRNLRLNPNDGTIAATDTPLVYATGDTNQGDEPNAAGAAYTNVDADAGTGTTLYIIDAANNTLATQGSFNSAPVSPNSGQLFTVGNLSVDPTDTTGFDIASNNTTGFLSIGKRIYGINLATGATTGGASVDVSGSTQIIDIAVAPSA